MQPHMWHSCYASWCSWVCSYVYVSIHIYIYIHISVRINPSRTLRSVCACAYVCVCVCMCVYVYACLLAPSIFPGACRMVCVCVCVCFCGCLCLCVCATGALDFCRSVRTHICARITRGSVCVGVCTRVRPRARPDISKMAFYFLLGFPHSTIQ